MAQAGKLDTPITILKHSVTISDFGDQTDTYTPDFNTRANVIPHTGNRTDASDEVQYVYRKTLIIRSYVVVNEFDRVRLNGKDYRILSIDKSRIKNHQSLEIELIHD